MPNGYCIINELNKCDLKRNTHTSLMRIFKRRTIKYFESTFSPARKAALVLIEARENNLVGVISLVRASLVLIILFLVLVLC